MIIHGIVIVGVYGLSPARRQAIISEPMLTYYQLEPLEQTSTNWNLTHWGRVMHICASKLTIIVSDNGLSPGRRQAIIWTNGGILLIWSLGTNFSEILIEI